MINIPKGTKDVLPTESYKWHFLEKKIRQTARLFGLQEVRTPTFEHTELFARGVGETTDIVNKEMYTFIDKGDRSITLKPEGTAGVARCFIENGLAQLPMPLRMYYITPVFRYERPQAGRLREHHQFGVEMYGVDSAELDVETMLIAKNIFDSLGIKGITLNVNNIGCGNCRPKYNQALRDHLQANLDKMCPVCQQRFVTNPLRILDCKDDRCKKVTAEAPSVLDFLCENCSSHHGKVVNLLDKLGVDYQVDPKIVRGLDYYTKTVFEFVKDDIGAKSTVCGGGRYNNLVAEVGGKPCPAVGFGLGLERLLLTIEACGIEIPNEEKVKVYIAPLNQSVYAMDVVAKLRAEGVSAMCDVAGRSVKAQMKYADKLGAEYVVVIGDNEIAEGVVTLKNMKTGESESVALSQLVNTIKGR